MLKIDHSGSDNLILQNRAIQVSHQCDDPACPGNINKQKLELFDRLMKAYSGSNMKSLKDDVK